VGGDLLLRLRRRQRGLPHGERDLADRDPEAIAVFFTIGTIFGAIGPAFCGALIGNGSSRTGLFIGYLIGINAEGKSLEDVTKPLTAAAE
jgi:hypothetical protein